MRGILFGLALIAASLLFPSMMGRANAQSGLIDLGKTLLGIEDEKPEIDYRPRPPLVVPPKKDLPPPAIIVHGFPRPNCAPLRKN